MGIRSFVHYDKKRNSFLVDDKEISIGSALSTRLLLNSLLNTREYSYGRLLDIGCGNKPYQSIFQAEDYIGVDWPNLKKQVAIEAYADAQALPFSIHSFDTVLCTEVIEHLQCPAKAIAEIKRVLKPGGYLILSAPFIHLHHEAPRDYFRFTFYGLQELVSQGGLTTLGIWGRGGTGSVIIDITSRLILSWLKVLLRKLHLPLSARNGLLRILIQTPQKMTAAIVLNGFPHNKDTNLLFSEPPAFSLGFTIIAQNLKDKIA